MSGSWLDLLFPPKCAVCQKEDVWVCESCLNNFSISPVIELPRLGQINRIIGAGRYQEPALKESIHQLKYDSVIGYASVLAELIVKRIPTNIFTDAILVPVPLHKQRLRARGFNQAQALAQNIAQLTQSNLLDCIVRTRYTDSQVSQKTKKDRIKNIAHSFAPTDKVSQLQGKSVIIIDDVITTGSTISDVARCITPFKPRLIMAVAAAIDA